MLLRHSLKLEDEARAIEQAIESVLVSGVRTADLAGGGPSVGTREMAAAIAAAVSGPST
jgi:3-isopropylmalate dehydrogenase